MKNNKKLYKDVCLCGHGFEVHIEAGCAVCKCQRDAPEDVRVLDLANLPAPRNKVDMDRWLD